MSNPFTGLKNREYELDFEFNGEKIKVRPKVGDAEMFMVMKDNFNQEEISKIREVIVGMIRRVYQDADVDDIRLFVSMNYMQLINELLVLFGFADKETLENLKKKVLEGDKKKQ